MPKLPFLIAKIPFPALFLLLDLSLPLLAISQNLDNERSILLDVKHRLGNPSSLQSWNSSSSPCDWPEITCTNNTVTAISLHNKTITKKIPARICDLENLIILNVSNNYIPGEFPDILNCSKLEYLLLWQNYFVGPIPDDIDRLSRLQYLDLTANNFSGDIPPAIGRLPELFYLFLVQNEFNGTWPTEIGNLANLEYLAMAYNDKFLPSALPKEFGALQKLKFPWMTDANLIGEIPESFNNLTRLKVLDLSRNNLIGEIPESLNNLSSLEYVGLSHNQLKGKIPGGFLMFKNLTYLYLNDNRLSGHIPSSALNLKAIDLSSNFTSLLPSGLSPNVTVFNMANNSFLVCQKFNGRSKLKVLDLSNNDLSGELPLCWKSWQSLSHVNLGNNKLSGKIPDSIGSLPSLKALHLQNNCLSGSIPSSLQDCTSLGLLDLSGNKLLGNIPNWIGELTDLKALCLRSNKLTGKIPSQICRLSSLIVLDVSDNELSGIIPRCLNNLTLMAAIETPNYILTDLEYFRYEIYSLYYLSVRGESEGLVLMTVGREFEYKEILKYVRMIDLSSNNLFGSIPIELSQLAGLRFLNLSRNHLMGRIPEKIGRMTSLLSLDLSINHLSGEIPQSLAELTFLNLLNLSYNQLWGRIPLSTQLQSFEAFSYIGNAQLCGAPLTKNCTGNEESQSVDTIDENEDGFETPWFYISMELGFIVGFWGVCGALLFKKNWRCAYFQFLDDIKDRVYVAVAIRLNWFHDNLRRLLVHHY